MPEALPVRPGALARARAGVVRRGVGATVRKAVADHVFRVSTSVILEYRTDENRCAPSRLPAGVTTAALRSGDALPALCPWLAHRAADFRAMLDTGKLGLFVLRDDVAVGCVWVSLDDHRDRAAREFYRVAPGEAYNYCWLIDPAERSRGLALPLARYYIAEMRARGVRRLFGVVDRVNYASYRVQQHLGCRECGIRVTHLYLLGTRWTFIGRYRGTLGPSVARPPRVAP